MTARSAMLLLIAALAIGGCVQSAPQTPSTREKTPDPSPARASTPTAAGASNPEPAATSPSAASSPVRATADGSSRATYLGALTPGAFYGYSEWDDKSFSIQGNATDIQVHASWTSVNPTADTLRLFLYSGSAAHPNVVAEATGPSPLDIKATTLPPMSYSVHIFPATPAADVFTDQEVKWTASWMAS